ncbi:hypothetical protein CTAYLR_002994 [Chrysophaeum taylorii]|uniref:Uncharacterized protein n=1 Tax=Chrysophaeum taylorii TaxID=2483200 RepID=A0AAD7U507_9STRA|nr:hypothetical protein CTAYLR_002994 [Chrysophaeum taylorii]
MVLVVVDAYGYPTVETREAKREQLRRVSRSVQERVPPWTFKHKVRAARGAVQQLRGDVSTDDLGALLELCAHARGPATYSEEVDALREWLVKEVPPHHVECKRPLPEVSESDSEETQETPRAETLKEGRCCETDIAETLCSIRRFTGKRHRRSFDHS